MKNIKHLITATSGAVLISIGLSAAPSLAVDIKTWNLKFFEYNNNLIGTGEFSYDQDVNTILNSFSATITFGSEYELDPFSYTWTLDNFLDRYYEITPWWYDPSAAVPFGNQWYDIYDWYETETGYVIDSGWQFGGRYEVNNYLTMDLVGPLSNNVFQGNWRAYTVHNDYGYIGSGGTWTASIPEPLTLLGTGTALGFGLLFKKKVSK